jgi:hypothetical protein
VSHKCSCGGCGSTNIKKVEYKSWFSQWFVMEEGVISVSLKNFTIFFALAISVALIAMLIASCNDGTGDYKCTFEDWPMVSDVIC